jgi:hypothetical protein
MKKIFATFFALTMLFSCNDSKVLSSDNGEFFFRDSEDCSCTNKDTVYTQKPDKAEVTIRVTVNGENPEVRVEVHEGSLEGRTVREIVSKTSRITDSLPLSVYTYVAKYKKGGDSIIVPVHAKLSADGHECNGYYCYEIVNNVIDLSLKF